MSKYVSYADYYNKKAEEQRHIKNDIDLQRELYRHMMNVTYGMSSDCTRDQANEYRTILIKMSCTPEKVIFNKPATIVLWKDGTKTVVKAQNDEPFDPEKGLAMAIAKKALGNEGNYFNHIKKWTEDVEEPYSYDENDVTPQAEKAYTLLTNILHKSKATKAQMTTAIEEAIGYLGEVLGEPKED